eukprot:gene3636-3897_t
MLPTETSICSRHNSFKAAHISNRVALLRTPSCRGCVAQAVKDRCIAGECSDSRQLLDRLFQLNVEPYSSFTDSSDSQLWQHGLFLVSVDDKPKNATKEKSSDYYANVGDAIRTLREDIPLLFERELNYDVYRDDITFRDPRNTFSGIKNYRLIFWSLRFHGRIFFKKLYVEVKRIWQPQDGLICMRWTVHGVPRVPWEAEGTFDGISQYKLDSEGKIYEHAVDNVILRDPPVQGIGPLLAGLNLVPGTPQQPCPGAWLKGLEEGAAAAAASAASAVSIGNHWLSAIVYFSWWHLYTASARMIEHQLPAADELMVPVTAGPTGPERSWPLTDS